MARQKVKFGTVELDGDFAGKELKDLPAVLETAYDVEMPSDCEYLVDGNVVEGTDILDDVDATIEIRAVPGKKA